MLDRAAVGVDKPISGQLQSASTGRSASPSSYRPDIDGLRAISIAAVVGFHAFPDHVRGGFVGVDVFFVISGYLITGIIVADLPRDGLASSISTLAGSNGFFLRFCWY